MYIFFIPDLCNKEAQEGVEPSCAHGSKVTKAVPPLISDTVCSIAIFSA